MLIKAAMHSTGVTSFSHCSDLYVCMEDGKKFFTSGFPGVAAKFSSEIQQDSLCAEAVSPDVRYRAWLGAACMLSLYMLHTCLQRIAYS